MVAEIPETKNRRGCLSPFFNRLVTLSHLVPFGSAGNTWAMYLKPIETLCELVAIPSVNPMGQSDDGPEFYEGRLTDHLQSIFERLGLAWQRQPVETGRDNIIARLDGSRPPAEGGRLILWEVHQDTVPVSGMTIAPFEPDVRDGRVYGRGACDVKGGMAAMLSALARLVEERPTDMPTVILACCVNEEHGFTGAKALTDLWADRSSGAGGISGREPSLIERRPDAAIVAEPTMLNVVVAHKGVVRWRCLAQGRAAHSSQPELGDNAIYRMGRVIGAIEQYHTAVLATRPRHPLCGGPTASVTTIRGGASVNTIPERASIEIDRRLTPDEDPQTAQDALIAYVSDQVGDETHIEHEGPYLATAGLSDGDNDQFARRLLEVARAANSAPQKPACQIVGVPYATDAAAIASSGVPTVVLGPGSIDQAHTADEWLDVEQLRHATDIYYRCVSCEFETRGPREARSTLRL